MLPNIKKAINYLKNNRLLSKLIKRWPKPDFKRGDDPFFALVEAIIYQQLSGKAAGTIFGRFLKLFPLGKPTPKKVLKLKDEQFKKVGVSEQKMKYFRDLSEKFLDGTVNPSLFYKMSDENIRTHLISVKGIGRWTADMFLMFTLNRVDIFPNMDLGIQKGIKKIFKLKKLPDQKKMEKLVEVWRPYRTVASWYIWKMTDEK